RHQRERVPPRRPPALPDAAPLQHDVLHPERPQVVADRQPRLARADHHHFDLLRCPVGSHRSSCCFIRVGTPMLRRRQPASPRQVAGFWPKNGWRWPSWFPRPGRVAGWIRGQQTWRVSHGGSAWARPPVLVGREPEQDRLAAAARAARAGRGQIVLISGEPGIGKTALLGSLVAHAAGEGARVASGAAEELEPRLPFAAVTDCLGLGAGGTDRGTSEIAALLRGSHRPPGGTFPTADAEFLVTEAILGLVDGWCAAGAVVLAMDDLQWADPASLLVLHRLRPGARPVPPPLAAPR